MLPLLVPALEAFAGFVAGEVLEYGVKKVIKKKSLSSLFGAKTKNLPVPVKKNLPVSVKSTKKSKKSNKVLVPISKPKPKPKPNSNSKINLPGGADLLDYSLSKLDLTNASLDNKTEVNVDNLVPNFEGLEIKPYNGDTLLDVLKTNSQNLNNSLTALTTLVGQGVVVLPLLLGEIKNLTNSVSSVSEALALSNVVGSDLIQAIRESKLDLSSVESSLNSISKAKDLEAEYHEFNKNPIQFTTSDGEVIANISPREIKARKNALDYHLANDEATLKFDDLGLNDYEDNFDIEKILELFKFVGIKSDLERLDNGS